MLYTKPDEWTNSKSKRVLLFGMSGLGKTYISNLLREDGDWFHYSIDYRIGTRYMGEFISDIGGTHSQDLGIWLKVLDANDIMKYEDKLKNITVNTRISIKDNEVTKAVE